MNNIFNPEEISNLSRDDSVTATINALRFITKKFAFNHLDGRVDWESRIESLAASEKQASSILSHAWDCAVRASTPDFIINAAIDYYTRAIESYSDALTYCSANVAENEAHIDQLTARTIMLLNALCTWKMLAYQAPEPDLAIKRLHVIDLWMYCKIDRQSGTPRTSTTTLKAANKKQAINLAGQLIYQSSEVSAALAQSILLETAGAETLSKNEITELIRVIWLTSEHLKFRSDLENVESALCFDAATGKAVLSSQTRNAQPPYAGVFICSQDIENVIDTLFGSHLQRGRNIRSMSLGQMLRRVMRNAWSGITHHRKTRMSGGLNSLRIDHGYQTLVRTIYEAEPPKSQLHNAELVDFSTGGCSLLIPKWIAGKHFSPGRMVSVAGQPPEIRHQYGTVTWMREYSGNRLMLQFGVSFFEGKPQAVMMRCERAFPSNLHVEKLLVEVLEEPGDAQATKRRILLPAGFYEQHLVLEDIQLGEIYTLGPLISTGSDFDMAELIGIGQSDDEDSKQAREAFFEKPKDSHDSRTDWSQKLQEAYALTPVRRNRL